jgi:hypothetical protein
MQFVARLRRSEWRAAEQRSQQDAAVDLDSEPQHNHSDDDKAQRLAHGWWTTGDAAVPVSRALWMT